MKRIMIFLMILTLCAAPLFSLAERRALSRQEAFELMDRMEEIYCGDDADYRFVKYQNEKNTRAWEKKYGPLSRWNGDLIADYVLEYGMMPTHDSPHTNPIAVYPDDARLSIEEARRIAQETAASVDGRLTPEKLESLDWLWEFDYCRDLGWFWTYDGTWLITWYDEKGLVCRAYIRDADGKPTVVFVYLDNHDPYTDDGVTAYTVF